jgi:2-keto-4-pentenoate hydratase
LPAGSSPWLAAFGEQLRSGEVIITGSVVPPLTIEADEDAIAFEVDPVARVAVRFSGEFKT